MQKAHAVLPRLATAAGVAAAASQLIATPPALLLCRHPALH